MMTCKTFVFLVSSGQMDDAPIATRWSGRVHRYMCQHCRTFQANDRVLTQVLDKVRQRQLQPEAPDVSNPADAP